MSGGAWHLRFYRRIRILPGCWLNLGRAGMSVTIGFPDFHLTIGRHGATVSSGIPGTGVSARRRIRTA